MIDMLNLFIVTLGVALGFILAIVVMFMIILQPKVMGWYVKKVYKLTEQIFDLTSKEFEIEETKTKDL